MREIKMEDHCLLTDGLDKVYLDVSRARRDVAKYLVKASYSTEGIKGVLKEGGSGRVAAVEQAMQSVGGKVEAFYFAFGSSDAYVILDLPDNASAAAVAAAVGSSGALSSYETVVLLTPTEVDQAMKKAVTYRPPGS